jgi:hypothetical protein
MLSRLRALAADFVQHSPVFWRIVSSLVIALVVGVALRLLGAFLVTPWGSVLGGVAAAVLVWALDLVSVGRMKALVGKGAGLLALLLLAGVLACGPKPDLEVQPKAPTVAPGGTQKLAAVVGTISVDVTWTANCGTVARTGVGQGLYTAPAIETVCVVTAAAVADPSVKGTSTITVSLPTNVVAITPTAPAVDACKTVSLSATATRGTVTYAVQEGEAGGTVTAAGVYTAPSNAGTYHVVATGSSGGSATAVVTVTERIVSVAVSPPSAELQSGGTQQLAATVTTTCGAFAATSPTGG